mmetsp:Transcript_66348/g.110262  ORF Transcript_66348/g.110262 Transcript_66348/m.110262 type:complete len:204 (+) Transcript_66348:90-701(+)
MELESELRRLTLTLLPSTSNLANNGSIHLSKCTCAICTSCAWNRVSGPSATQIAVNSDVSRIRWFQLAHPFGAGATGAKGRLQKLKLLKRSASVPLSSNESPTSAFSLPTAATPSVDASCSFGWSLSLLPSGAAATGEVAAAAPRIIAAYSCFSFCRSFFAASTHSLSLARTARLDGSSLAACSKSVRAAPNSCIEMFATARR